MPSDSAYLLVAHGSRDPRFQIALERLATLVHQQLIVAQSESQKSVEPASVLAASAPLSAPAAVAPLPPGASTVPLVGTACLEVVPQALHIQIQEFCQQAISYGNPQVKILPLFLLPGVHVMDDIPTEITIAQQALGSKLALDLRAYLGSHPGVIRLLINQVSTLPSQVWILVSHGSRRQGGNDLVEAIAAELGAVTAYWSVPPDLTTQVTDLIRVGYRQIAVLPYFLFSGGITDAIAQTMADLSGQFPEVEFQLGSPLGANAGLANLILDLA
ncbi:MAG: sirohydrochlorin chelatase [Cyanothece sp. SIO1E1]|nr:sirohydrochlorin chelatase [Cyanothece sp. SIO1E1]